MTSFGDVGISVESIDAFGKLEIVRDPVGDRFKVRIVREEPDPTRRRILRIIEGEIEVDRRSLAVFGFSIVDGFV